MCMIPVTNWEKNIKFPTLTVTSTICSQSLSNIILEYSQTSSTLSIGNNKVPCHFSLGLSMLLYLLIPILYTPLYSSRHKSLFAAAIDCLQ